jgi:hypothetical protein
LSISGAKHSRRDQNNQHLLQLRLHLLVFATLLFPLSSVRLLLYKHTFAHHGLDTQSSREFSTTRFNTNQVFSLEVTDEAIDALFDRG